MGLLDGINPFAAISKAIFGEEGAAKGITTVLEKAGVLKNLTPEEKQAASAALQQYELDMQTKANDASAQINQTMQAEDKSEHWASWLWRPMVGFTFCAILINNYILLPYFSWAKDLPIPDHVWSAFLVILGAAAAGRSLEKWQGLKNDGTANN